MFQRQRKPSYQYRSAVVGSVSAQDAEVLMGTNLECKGIHVPKDASPRTLGRGQAREFWDAAYKAAMDYYHDEEHAKKVAWKSVRLFFRDSNGSWNRHASIPQPTQAPRTFIGDPGDLTDLGLFLEFTYIDADARLQIRKFPTNDPPHLYYSARLRTLYVFPGMEIGECQTPDMKSDAAAMFQVWAQRPAHCERYVDIPEVDVTLVGNADTLVYRSDKFHDRNPDKVQAGSQEYIHQFGDGVGLWLGPGEVPAAIAITGGCLDVEARGIIH